MNFIQQITSLVGSCVGANQAQIDYDVQMTDVSAASTEAPSNASSVVDLRPTSQTPQVPSNGVVIMPMEVSSNVILPKNAVIYLRVSTQEQNLDAQQHSCLAYCTRLGLKAIEIVQEKLSAYRPTKGTIQPGLDRLLAKHTNVTLIVFSIDRFSRNVDNCNRLIDLMEQNKIVLRCVKENVCLETALGKHNFRSIVSLAQYESELIGERQRNSIKYKRDNKMHIGRAPYGFSVDKDTKQLIPNKNEMHVIEYIVNSSSHYRLLRTMTQDLFALMRKLGFTNEADYVPLESVQVKRGVEYACDKKHMRVTASVIADVLNDYNITNRGKQWTASGSNRIARIYFKSRKSCETHTLFEQFSKMSVN